MDCRDNSDEMNCQGFRLSYTLLTDDVTPTSVKVQVTNIWSLQINPQTQTHGPGVIIALLRSPGQAVNKTFVVTADQTLPMYIILDHLQSSVSYELTLRFVSNDGVSGPEGYTLRFATGNEAPQPPSGLKAWAVWTSNQECNIELSWTPVPSGAARPIRYYTVFYEDVVVHNVQQKIVYINDSTAPAVRDHIDSSTLMLGHQYFIWVTAFNGLESFPSNRTSVSTDRNTNCVQTSFFAESDISAALTIITFDMNSAEFRPETVVRLRLSFNGNGPETIVRYEIGIVSRSTVENRTFSAVIGAFGSENCTVHNCFVKVHQLNPASSYELNIQAVSKDPPTRFNMCTRGNLTILTKGNRPNAPVIPSISIVNDLEASVVAMTRDFDPSVPETLAVYWVLKSDSNQFMSTAIMTYNLTTKLQMNEFRITGLLACENYCFAVQRIWPARSALAIPAPPCLTTNDAAIAPPKKLVVHEKSHDVLMAVVTVEWEPPCRPRPMDYFVEVTMGNVTNAFPASEQTGMLSVISLDVAHINRGANCSFVVYAAGSGMRHTAPVFKVIAPFPAPMEFRTLTDLYHETGMFKLQWSAPRNFPEDKIDAYEVFHATDLHDGDTNFVLYATTTAKNLTIDTLPYVHDHSFKVRMVAKSGYPGLFTNIETVKRPNNAKELELLHPHDGSATPKPSPANSGLVAGLVVFGCIIITVLVTVLIFYVVRHRRLQNSFTSFANSHYDNRSGTTTFGTNDLEVDDQPMIRCFADDEPLIVA